MKIKVFIKKRYEEITNYYENLVNLTKNKYFVGPTNEWFIDNYYLIREAYNQFISIKKDRKFLRTIDNSSQVEKMLKKILKRYHYTVDINILEKEINRYQKDYNYYFSYEEIDTIPYILYALLFDKLLQVARDENKRLEGFMYADKIMDNIASNHYNKHGIFSFEKEIPLKDKLINNKAYIYRLNERLQELGISITEGFKEFNQMLLSKKINIKDVIASLNKKQVENNIVTSNAFLCLKHSLEIDTASLYQRISYIEKELEFDQVYKDMTDDTKDLYRKQIIKNAKEDFMDEYTYVHNLIIKSLKENKHIGFYIFKKKNIKNREIIYLLTVFLGTIILSYLLSIVLFRNILLGFILLLIPCSDIVIKTFQKIVSHIYKPKNIPKMNYLEGVPKSASTMMVIPTIIKNTDKIDEMYKKLEEFYLVNNTDNLYFALMGDACEASSKTTSFDENVADYGIKVCERLNKKYHKNIFFFAYRNRFYNKSMDCYLGYERKRGALIDFNKLLLKQYSKEQINSYFRSENISNISYNIKYVITLDADTDLVLNTALNLIGAMDHPLNKPVYNKEKTKIIDGYALIQPRISMDIESTNQSIYSQTFAGVGGFSVYNSTVSDFYQDYFNEGNFVGKGIYNLEVYDNILSVSFPNNLILSHDLLEGLFLRCALASDIEFIDDFPSSYQVDMTRRERWARGDTQIIGFLKKNIKTKDKVIKNPLTLTEQFRIFDNIRRMFVYLFFVLILLFNTVISKNPYFTILFLFFVLLLSTILSILDKIHIKINNEKRQHYHHHENIMYGNRAVLLRSFISFITIPYTTLLYLKAFITSIYRMKISKKKLLSWLTAEDASLKVSNSLKSYFKKFYINYIFSILLIIITLLTDKNFIILPLFFSISFLSAPFVLNYVSTVKKINKNEDLDKEEIKKLAKDTWSYFDTLLQEKYNYLIPDNYQENRENEVDLKTSPTNIGFSLTSIISAYELSFITLDKASSLLTKVIKTVEKLDKVEGHLYNWYDIKTKEVKVPKVISSVDSGNFVASLIVVREFALTHDLEQLYLKVDKLIKNTNFKMLYTTKNVFSVSYDTIDSKLSEYNYNKFASESRLLGYVAIALKQVPIKHWLSLDKTLTKYKNHKGLISWSGTSFEYFMPFLFMKNYRNTLLDESYFFAYFCQREYMEKIDRSMPWGISESAYSKVDEKMNYKYRYFSTPFLKLQQDMTNRVVISPYSSIMALELYPNSVYDNIKKFKKLNMYGKYGLYEAYDYDAKERVLSYFAHHQGMILAGLTNYLKKDVLKEYFHHNTNMRAYEMLLKEKVNINCPIDLHMNAYKRYNFERENVANDIRVITSLSDTSEFSVLSNSKYSVLINDRGNGFSRYKDIQINRYRKISNQDYGTYLYIRDLNTNKIWSNTYAPVYKHPDKYEVVFATDRAKFIREDDNLVVKTEIIVTKKHNAEIRKYTFLNDSNIRKDIEITSYNEVVLDHNLADINHRTFNNLFIHSEVDRENNALIVCRNNREDFSKSYAFSRLLNLNSTTSSVFISEREDFIKRGNDLTHPGYLFDHKETSVGTNIDPIMAITEGLTLLPKEKKEVYFIMGYARSREEVNDILKDLNEKQELEEAFTYATIANNENTKLLDLEGYEMRTYNTMLNYIYQTSKVFINDDRINLLSRNSCDQRGLWKFGISGDLPIMLVNIKDLSSLGFVKEVLKSYLYFKNRSIFMDLVIINSEDDTYSNVIKKEIELELYRMRTLFSIDEVPGSIFILDNDKVSDEEEILLNMVSRIKFDTSKNTSLHESMEEISKQNSILMPKRLEYEMSFPSSMDTKKLDFYNEYGGFSNDGASYVITNENTKTPWSFVLANDNFGSIMTNSMCGFTYAYNSGMYKISTWTNDIVVNDRTEGILINGKYVIPSITKYSFGIITYIVNTKDYTLNIDVSVCKSDPVKLYKIRVDNNTKKELNLDISFFINPTLGAMSEKTNRYILSEHTKDYLYMRNVYTPYFSDKTVFMTSSLKINSFDTNQVTKKAITSKVKVSSSSHEVLSFALGCSSSSEMVNYLAVKYQDIKTVSKEIKSVEKYWQDMLGVIKVKTNDKSFDYMLNGWYLYQTIASRIKAKAGFYQVGGAFGYRDQLQDAMNICTTHPDITRKQIIENAMHQFREGDVLHWWHNANNFGLRSRYKDDYLWLVYATGEYVKITEDISILEEEIPFVDARSLNDDEKEVGVEYTITEEKVPLYEHLKKSIDYSLSNMATNGLPLMGGGDWNDGMNKIGIKGKGSSVWLGFFLYINLERFIDITRLYDINLDVSYYEDEKEKLAKALDKAFENNYYLRAYFDDGEKLGSSDNKECKIDLISQAFAILSGLSKDKTNKVIKSVEDNLVDHDLEIIKLLTPAFVGLGQNPGYIASYPDGIRENGGQYTHATAWYIMALLKVGEYDKAYKYYEMINPINRSKTKEDSDIYKIEPYVISADIYSNKDKKKRGGWSWYTGSAGWYYKVGICDILGFNLRGSKLYINPHNTFDTYNITYRYMNTTYEILVKKDKMNKIKVDNKKVDVIELKNDLKTHNVEVYIKED